MRLGAKRVRPIGARGQGKNYPEDKVDPGYEHPQGPPPGQVHIVKPPDSDHDIKRQQDRSRRSSYHGVLLHSYADR